MLSDVHMRDPATFVTTTGLRSASRVGMSCEASGCTIVVPAAKPRYCQTSQNRVNKITNTATYMATWISAHRRFRNKGRDSLKMSYPRLQLLYRMHQQIE